MITETEEISTTESLFQSEHYAKFTRLRLLDANRGATPLESMLLLPLIEQAERLRAGIEALREARNA